MRNNLKRYGVVLAVCVLVCLAGCKDTMEGPSVGTVKIVLSTARSITPEAGDLEVKRYALECVPISIDGVVALTGKDTVTMGTYVDGTAVNLRSGVWNFTVRGYNSEGIEVSSCVLKEKTLGKGAELTLSAVPEKVSTGKGTLSLTLRWPQTVHAVSGIVATVNGKEYPIVSASSAVVSDGYYVCPYVLENLAVGTYTVVLQLRDVEGKDILASGKSDELMVYGNLVSKGTVTLSAGEFPLESSISFIPDDATQSYLSTQDVTLSFTSSMPDAVLVYTTDNGQNWAEYQTGTTELRVGQGLALGAKVKSASAGTESAVTRKNYVQIRCEAPTMTVSDVDGGKEVTFTNGGTAGSTMHYSIDGGSSWSSATGTVTASLKGNGTYVLKAYSTLAKCADSDIVEKSVNAKSCAVPTIMVNDITGGKEVVFTNNGHSAGEKMRYSVDGGTSYAETTNGSVTIPFTKEGSNSLKAYAVLDGYTESEVVEGFVTVGKCESPKIIVAIVAGGKDVTFSNSGTAGAMMHYATDGINYQTTTDATVAIRYQEAGSHLLKAYATLSGYVDSDKKEMSVSVNQCEKPTIEVVDIIGGKRAVITNTGYVAGATMRYTTDRGTNWITATEEVVRFDYKDLDAHTLEAYSKKEGYVDSMHVSEQPKVTVQCSNPAIAVQEVSGGKTITFTNTTQGATMYYSTDGGANYRVASGTGTASVTLTSIGNYALRSYAEHTGYKSSGVAERDERVEQCEKPLIQAEFLSNGIKVTVFRNNSDGTLYYSKDNGKNYMVTDEVTRSFTYTGSDDFVMKAYVSRTGYVDSEMTILSVSKKQCLMPLIDTINSEDGRSARFVNRTAGAILHYSIDGGEGTFSTSATIETVDLPTAGTYTLQAYATLSGYMESPHAQLDVTVEQCAQPAGIGLTSIPGGKKVTFTNSSTSRATLHYSTDDKETYNTSTNASVEIEIKTAGSYACWSYATLPGMLRSSYISKNFQIVQCGKPTITIEDVEEGKDVTFTNSSTSGSTLYYSTDGGLSYLTSTNPSVTVSLDTVGTFNLKAYAIQDGYVDSEKAEATASVSQCTEVASIGEPTNIEGGKSVTITNSTASGAILKYSQGGVYKTSTDSSVVVEFMEEGAFTLKAYVAMKGYKSGVGAEKPVTVTKLTTPTISVTDITNGKKVSFTTASGTTLHYSMDGGSTYSTSTDTLVEVSVTTASTVNAVAYSTTLGYVDSDEVTKEVKVDKVASPTIAEPKDIEGGKSVEISTTVSGATLNYLKEGSIYSTGSSPVTVSITSAGTFTVKAYASLSGYVDSDEVTKEVKVEKCASPTIAEPKDIEGGKSVEISTTVSGATLNYLKEGSIYSTGSSPVTVELKSAGTFTVKAYASLIGYVDSDEATKAVTVEKCASPTIADPTAIVGGKSVEISTTVFGSTLHYLKEGSIYSTVSGSDPVTVELKSAGTFTVKAYVSLLGYVDSDEATKAVTVEEQCAPPTIADPTTYMGQESVVITPGSTANSYFYYSVDDGVNLFASHSAAFTVYLTPGASYSFLAFAVLEGHASSEIVKKTVVAN